MTAPLTIIARLDRIRKIAESIRVTEGSEVDSLLANITGACDLATQEILRANLPGATLTK
jgi:hypothetical protein